MKTWMKILMWAGLGSGISFFAGYQIGRRSGEKNLEERERKSYDDGRRYGYDEGYQSRRDEEFGRDDLENSLREYGGDFDGDSLYVNTDSTPVVHTQDEVPVIDDDEDAEEIPELHPQDMIPEIISADDFLANKWQYDKEDMVYYGMDDVLYNVATRSVIKEPDEVVGIGTLFGFYPTPEDPEGKDTIFVRNDTLGMLFRITHMDAAWCDTVDGVYSPDFAEEDSDS